MARKSLKLLRRTTNSFYSWVKKLHYWMMKKPKDDIILKGSNVILLGVNGLLLSEILMPTVLGNIAEKPFVIAIIGVMLTVFLWGITGIIKTLTEKEITVPLKYKFLAFLLFIPLLIFINKFLVWFKLNYVKQNNDDN